MSKETKIINPVMLLHFLENESKTIRGGAYCCNSCPVYYRGIRKSAYKYRYDQGLRICLKKLK
jgi:hypothetical protein